MFCVWLNDLLLKWYIMPINLEWWNELEYKYKKNYVAWLKKITLKYNPNLVCNVKNWNFLLIIDILTSLTIYN